MPWPSERPQLRVPSMSQSPRSLLSIPVAETYTDGSYAAVTGGTWHVEDSAFKAGQVLRMLRRHPNLKPGSICDIGCGAGGVLAELDRKLDSVSRFQGYEVSPQAHALSQRFTSARCEYLLGDPF